MIDNRIVGKRIATLRQKHRLTQQQLAAMLRVSHQAVSKWESGQTLPDIQTMLELTRFFGITVEQLVSSEEEEETTPSEETTEETQQPTEATQEGASETTPKDAKCMRIQRLLQMAPFMSREAVEEIAMNLEDKISASQLTRLAPFVRPACLDVLLERHHPEISWENLRRIAPFMNKETVDRLARSVAAGEENIFGSGDHFNTNLNKTFNDIGKAFDGLGKGLEKAAKKTVKKTMRFGKKIYNEVANVIDDFSADVPEPVPTPVRSERFLAIRQKAFERALQDERWDWIGQHIHEIDADTDLKARIAAHAREKGKYDWLCEFMGGYADDITVEAAVSGENWSWLGENTWQMNANMQEKVALAAKESGNWQWLEQHMDQLDLRECALEIALAAWEAGERNLPVLLAEQHMAEPQIADLACAVYAAEDFETLDRLLPRSGDNFVETMLRDLAEKGNWNCVQRYVQLALPETVEVLMETAVEQGNFDAVDMLESCL